ncbi:MAG: LysM peptidoglycan-binding domain-containing protein [Mariprofundus sp.]|nr:LysM peptidoglycan-binding domain-containing protein [Mariprofundus sp.]
MPFKTLILSLLAALCLLASPMLQAADYKHDTNSSALKADIKQPYVVKKGDTLWHIADYFFQNPSQWIKLWERNLYITNPDLIYPGNKIWFDGTRLRLGGLSLVKPVPKVIIKPVERLEAHADTSVLLTALARQDFIQPDQDHGVGHVLDSLDDRLNYGVNDHIYLHMNQPSKIGALFDIFRNSDVIHDPVTGKAAGILVEHMGQVRITSVENGVYRGVIVKSFEEISRGDRLKPARSIDHHITPIQSTQTLSGNVMYIRNNAREAAQNQVIGISLGLGDGLKAGTIMTIYKSGRIVSNQINDKAVLLPSEKVGELLVLVPQQHASIALITQSTAPIHLGDSIKTSPTP